MQSFDGAGVQLERGTPVEPDAVICAAAPSAQGLPALEGPALWTDVATREGLTQWRV
ncbi:hypothetical protein ACLKOZ_08210 [Arthrobacter sp. R4]|uniref:hypothetical protein n=1 Tax=Arthrobacter sp. R4 TaxID=644417 RepID=UPI003EDA6835